jgi:putative hemolysin
LDNPAAYFLVDNFPFPIFLAINVQATAILAAGVIFLLILSFFISGAEIAFFSLTARDINTLKTKQDPAWKRIADLLEEPRSLLASIMIANVVVNIAVIVLTNLLIDQVIPTFPKDRFWPWVELIMKVVLITSVIVLFGEVLPKMRASHNNLRTAYETSYLVELISYAFGRIGKWLLSITGSIERSLTSKKSKGYNQQQLEEAIRSTVHEVEEQRILAGIYKFGNITVKQIMRSRLDVSGIDYNISFKELKQKVEELHYSRLPVYRGSLDDIAGLIHTKDVIQYLDNADDFDWHSVLRTPYFVHEQKYIEDLLKEFQTKRTHFAVVVDEFGGTSGIVTMEDILEEVVGEIKDEFDEEETGNKKIDETTFVFEGNTMIYDACNAMGLPSETFDNVRGDSDSIAGLMLELAGEIPKVNDVFTVGDFEFVILEVDRNRIRKVKVLIKPQVA